MPRVDFHITRVQNLEMILYLLMVITKVDEKLADGCHA